MNILILMIFLIIIILFYVGIVHFFWWLTIHQEKKPHKYGKTSNGRAFHFITERSGHGFLHSWVEGTLDGTTPNRNETAYLTDGGRTRPVLLIGIRMLDQTAVSNKVRVRFRLFGAGRNVTALAELTSVRPQEPSQVPTFDEVPTPEQFPLVGLRRKNYLPLGITATCMGLFMFWMFGVTIALHAASEGELLVIFLAGLFMFLVGSGCLLDIFRFRVIMNRDYSIDVRTMFRSHRYHLYNLSCSISIPDHRSEKLRLTLRDSGKRTVAVLDEGSRNFHEICCWVTEVRKRKQLEESRRYLLEMPLFLPLERSEAPDAAPDSGSIYLMQSKDGREGLPAFTAEEQLWERYRPEHFIAKSCHLPYLVELTRDFSLADDIVIFTARGEIDIDRDEWKKIAALRDHPMGTLTGSEV